MGPEINNDIELIALEQRLLRKRLQIAEDNSVSHRAKSTRCPLSFAQQRMWFLNQLEPDSPQYNIPLAFRLSGTVRPELLERALNAIVARHESLRTTFTSLEGEAGQVIAQSLTIALRLLDLRQLPDGQREAEALQIVQLEAQHGFDLTKGPLLRAGLITLGESDSVFFVVVHHIVFDGASGEIFLRELSQTYQGFAAGEHSPLGELPVQYADFAERQHEILQERAFEQQLTFWKAKMNGVLPILDFPTDHPRPERQTFAGAIECRKVSKQIMDSLRQLANSEAVTLFMTVLGAFEVLLYRYTGQKDIIIGIPVAGRDRVELENVIGLFVNTLPVRTDLSGDPSFRELLQRVRKNTLQAFIHRDLPFERLVQELEPQRDLSCSPLFQMMFVFQNGSPTLQFPEVKANSLDVHSGTAKFDLTLNISYDCDDLGVTLEYNRDLFEAATARRILGHFQQLLDSVTANPEQRISELPLLLEAERRQILVEWNNTKREYPQLRVYQLFEEQAERIPDATAVVFEDNSVLTYRGLNERANRLAHELRKHGAGPDQLVGMCMERSVDMIAALLAIIKAGAAYVPLDPHLPASRLSYMIEDSRLKILFTQRQIRSSLPPFAGIIIEIDGGQWESNSRENLDVRVSPENLALVIYTSGSTGRPKGVEIPIGALTNVLWCMRGWLGLKSGDTLLAVTTISFDISGIDVWLPLLVGARSVIASRDAAADGRRLREMIERYQVNLLQATPVTWRLLLAAGWQGKADLTAVCTGEAMPREVAAQLCPRVGRLAESLRAHGNHDLVHRLPGAERRRAGSDRPPGGQHAVLHLGRVPKPGSHWRNWRVVHRRERAGAGLPEPASAVEREVRSKSLRAGKADVSHGGLGATTSRRQHRVSRPRRPTDQDTRFSCRTR